MADGYSATAASATGKAQAKAAGSTPAAAPNPQEMAKTPRMSAMRCACDAQETYLPPTDNALRAMMITVKRIGIAFQAEKAGGYHATIKSYPFGVYPRLHTLRSASVIEYGNTQCA
jgi:hypothetical protein